MAGARTVSVLGGRRASLVAVFVCAVAAFAAVFATAQPPPPPPLPPQYHKIHPGRFGKREMQLSCNDQVSNQPTCTAKCDAKRCPDQCIVLCPSCKTFCECDFYPGMACGDPRFTGGDGSNFYFHGRKDRNFCILSDANLHINAHFIGKRNPAMSRDFTWIQALGIRFADHRLFVGAQKTAKWDSEVDRLMMAFDGTPIDIPEELGERWVSPVVPELSVTRTAAANGVELELKGVFNIMASVVPITEKDSRIHNYGVTEDDSLAHLDLGFKFHALTEDVHGVLGQTYRLDYVNKLNVSSNMPVMGGVPNYVTSDIFSADCTVARFGRGNDAGVSMATEAS